MLVQYDSPLHHVGLELMDAGSKLVMPHVAAVQQLLLGRCRLAAH